MKTNIMKKLNEKQIRTDLPDFRIGDILKVFYKIVEGGKERIQPFEGTLIGRHGGGIAKTFTMRKISFGEGVERTFPLASPRIEKIEVVRHGEVRRAKLYYIREKVGKKSKIKEKKTLIADVQKEVPQSEAPVKIES
ncbi:MAG: 50S ribosomal protein L19 [Chlamydiae bacterium]|nr:50S ribosomal protein L19 [Chlamydiota bacterium]MBI3277804.1 50S ribosomal protein L19 [Chlamydiota bacterium]